MWYNSVVSLKIPPNTNGQQPFTFFRPLVHVRTASHGLTVCELAIYSLVC
jgi:hypothetical protein